MEFQPNPSLPDLRNSHPVAVEPTVTIAPVVTVSCRPLYTQRYTVPLPDSPALPQSVELTAYWCLLQDGTTVALEKCNERTTTNRPRCLYELDLSPP
jgi:hypothetical protein